MQTREKVEAEYLAWYECEFCSDKWDDEIRNRAVRGWALAVKGKASAYC